ARAAQMVVPEGGLVFTRDAESSEPLVLGGEYGQGRYLLLALPFDERTDLGVSRFPYLTRDAFRHFKLRPQFSAPGLHAFFEPDARAGGSELALLLGKAAGGLEAVRGLARGRGDAPARGRAGGDCGGETGERPRVGRDRDR